MDNGRLGPIRPEFLTVLRRATKGLKISNEAQRPVLELLANGTNNLPEERDPIFAEALANTTAELEEAIQGEAEPLVAAGAKRVGGDVVKTAICRRGPLPPFC